MHIVHPVGAFIAIAVMGLVMGVYLGLVLAPWLRKSVWAEPGYTSQREQALELRIRAWRTLWAWETGVLKDHALAKRAVLQLKALYDDPKDVRSGADLLP